MIRIIVTISFLYFTHNVFSQGNFYSRLSDSAMTLIYQKVAYDPKYFVIKYPNGDVPFNKGVCTDVIIRAYRKVGIDLQKEVHEDMSNHFRVYPSTWGLKSPDKNIDHRRVPNLMKFFERRNGKLEISSKGIDYRPGDIVCWRLKSGVPHIGLVVNRKSVDGKRNLVIHNIGAGQVIEDCLFSFTIIGHYRYGQ